MKQKISVLYLLLLLLPLKAFSIYDLLSIDITPRDNAVEFCFNPDYTASFSDGNAYVAAQIEGDFFFVSQSENGIALNKWQAGVEPPFYAERRSGESCVGPFPETTLQGIPVFAGVGTSFDDIASNARYAVIFDGTFSTLPQPQKTWTVMIYMVGSDLESNKYHFASSDILEMLQGTQNMNSDAVNVVIATGGSARTGWKTVKYSRIQNGQHSVLKDLNQQNMADSTTLSDFVTWTRENFPADHNALILWNHGAGTMGFGLDSMTKELMPLNGLNQAYEIINENGKLDIVTYDACLMASIEVAEVTAKVAQVMSASAELEPGHGLNYHYLFENMATNLPENGIDFGRIVKEGYIQQTKDTRTFDWSNITYSVFDLSHINSFNQAFSNFATEFNVALELLAFSSYEVLSRGLIKSLSYPVENSGKFNALSESHVLVDLYGILQSMSPVLPELKSYADRLVEIMDKMVVDYAGNVRAFDPKAGRISIDIGSEESYLSVLPEAFALFDTGLDSYYNIKQNDLWNPEGGLTPADCPTGFICADLPNWLELEAMDTLGVESYLGQQAGEMSDIYLVQSLYQYTDLTEEKEIPIDKDIICQYQVCVDETQCENMTLKEQGNRLMADISLNDFPAILSFCQAQESETWLACGVAQQTNGVWGRNAMLLAEDEITPKTLHIQNNDIEQRTGNTLVVAETDVVLKKSCDLTKSTVFASYFGLNGQKRIEQLCKEQACSNAGVLIKP